ncbi:Hypothetical predicted protein [Paramuricea clavata]|uniref:Uncharacterized protein n=1 Tax=Paramuricea clavata TaxID=317549 RepID=A0A6S7JIT0_PARCT|nr:Hypothetical predicted protein [Paramuricea clavata]
MNMDEVQRPMGKANKSNNGKAKKQLSERLDRALEEAENLFSTPKAGKMRKKSHIEIRRDNKGNRVYHCPRKGSIR